MHLSQILAIWGSPPPPPGNWIPGDIRGVIIFWGRPWPQVEAHAWRHSDWRHYYIGDGWTEEVENDYDAFE